MGTLFYLTIAASHYPPAHLTYNNSKCYPNVFVRCGACLRAEWKDFQELILSMVKKNPIQTAKHWTEMCELRLTANWNSGKHCAACRITNR